MNILAGRIAQSIEALFVNLQPSRRQMMRKSRITQSIEALFVKA
jgi:hypothetical protein